MNTKMENIKDHANRAKITEIATVAEGKFDGSSFEMLLISCRARITEILAAIIANTAIPIFPIRAAHKDERSGFISIVNATVPRTVPSKKNCDCLVGETKPKRLIGSNRRQIRNAVSAKIYSFAGVP